MDSYTLQEIGTLGGMSLWMAFVGWIVIRNAWHRQYMLEQAFLQEPRMDVWQRAACQILPGIIAGLFASLLIWLMNISMDISQIMFYSAASIILAMFRIFRYSSYLYASILMYLLMYSADMDLTPYAIVAPCSVFCITEGLLSLCTALFNQIPVFQDAGRSRAGAGCVEDVNWPLLCIITFTSGGWSPMLLISGSFYQGSYNAYSHRMILRGSVQTICAAFLAVLAWCFQDQWIGLYIIHFILVLLVEGVQCFSVHGPKLTECDMPPRRGLHILYTLKDSPARAMGMRSGDVLLEVNGRTVNSERMISEMMMTPRPVLWAVWLRGDVKMEGEQQNYKDPYEELGIIALPLQTGHYYRDEIGGGLINAITDWKKHLSRSERWKNR